LHTIIIFSLQLFITIFINLKFEMEEKIFLTRVAEQAERFEDMVAFLEEAI
jgi:hypothetical protein